MQNELLASQYHEYGFVEHPGVLTESEISELNQAVDYISQKDYPGHVWENHGNTLRALHGCHLYNEAFANLIRKKVLVSFAKDILQDDVYVHQLKVNTKRAHHGESWPWHQDFIFWHHHDDMPSDRVTNVMINLDEVNDENGPLNFIPKSHQWGCLLDKTETFGSSGWEDNVSNDLTYQLKKSFIDDIREQFGVCKAIGPAGAAWWFSGNLCHASSANHSKYERKVLIVTYNAVCNAPDVSKRNFGTRPDFLCARDFTPIYPLET